MKKQIRFITLLLCFMMAISILSSCAPRPLAQSGIAGKDVGTIKGGSEDYTVAYEELYPHAKTYYEIAKAKYGDDTEAIKTEVWETLKSKLILNYAILELCKDSGIEYDEKALRDRVNEFIQSEADASFDGDCSAFLEEKEKEGFTDHYIRFAQGVDLLYSDLVLEYQKTGVIPNTDEAMKQYIKENLIHTWHLAIYVEDGEDRDAEYARAQEALEKLKSGTSMYYLISGGYTDDTTLPMLSEDTYGEIFHRDVCTLGEDFGKFALELNASEISDIKVTTAIHPYTNKTVECFYIIQRLPLKNSEIENNFTLLSDEVKNAVAAKKLDEKIKTLSFEPNEYALGLDLASLEAPENGMDYQLVIGICVSIGAVVILISSIFVFRALRAKRFQKNLKKSKTEKSLKKK